MTFVPRFLNSGWAGIHVCLLVMATLATTANAQGFALSVSPPRFEVQIKAGERIRQVLEINNASDNPSKIKIKTADWTLAPDGSVIFEEALLPGSCRPWVALERLELVVPAKRPYRFRFEVAAPSDAIAAECRFALLLEGEDQTVNAGSLALPYNARLGVIVYAAVGNVAPRIEVIGSSVQAINGKPTAVLKITNSGNAHGRLGGFLSGTDAAGVALEFSPTPSPILPGETRSIALMASKPGDSDTTASVTFPVTVTGKLEWGKNQSMALEQRFAP